MPTLQDLMITAATQNSLNSGNFLLDGTEILANNFYRFATPSQTTFSVPISAAPNSFIVLENATAGNLVFESPYSNFVLPSNSIYQLSYTNAAYDYWRVTGGSRSEIARIYTEQPPIPSTVVLSASLNGSYGEYRGRTFTEDDPSSVVSFSAESLPSPQWSSVLRINTAGGTPPKIFVPDSEDFNFGSADFCIEFLSRRAASFINWNVAYMGQLYESAYAPLRIDFSRCSALAATVSNNWQVTHNPDGINAFLLNLWQHVAICRQGSEVRLYIQGILVDTANWGSISLVNAPNPFYIWFGVGADGITYLANYRIHKGDYVYSANFVPNFDPYP